MPVQGRGQGRGQGRDQGRGVKHCSVNQCRLPDGSSTGVVDGLDKVRSTVEVLIV